MVAAQDDPKGPLEEIQTCAKEYLKAIEPSFSLRGAWHVVLRRITASRINAIVDAAKRDLGASNWRFRSAGLADWQRLEREMERA